MLEGKVAIDRHLIQWERLGEGEGGGNNNPSRFMLRKPEKAIVGCATWLARLRINVHILCKYFQGQLFIRFFLFLSQTIN